MDHCCAADFRHESFQSNDCTRVAGDGLLAAPPRPLICSTDRFRTWSRYAHRPTKAREVVSALADLLRPLLNDEADQASHRLMKQFGSVGRLLDASPASIRAALPGQSIAADMIVAARDLTRFGWSEILTGQPVDIDTKDFQTYLKAQLQTVREERILAIFLNAQGLFIQDEIISRGNLGQTQFEARHLVQRIFDLQARKVLLAHNHPSGSWKPSQIDERTTDRLLKLLMELSVELSDHLIVASGQIFSMRRRAIL